MKWQGRRGSRNIEDRRSNGRRTKSSAKAGGLGIFGLIAIVGFGLIFDVDVGPLLNGLSGETATTSSSTQTITAADQERAEFVSVTLADTEEIWQAYFDQHLDQSYAPPTLVLYKGVTSSSCGNASGATGPFYCPGDEKIYLDTDFFTTMSTQLGAKGDFAAAYVVAHEVAHYIQDQLGILGRANKVRAQVSETDANAISMRVELMADCFAGIWAREADARFDTLERGDINEALNAAKQIGDDTLQRNAGRVPQPHTFSHGTSDQRQRWFKIGYKQGSMVSCDTFAVAGPTAEL